jgi:hypothetical protein
MYMYVYDTQMYMYHTYMSTRLRSARTHSNTCRWAPFDEVPEADLATYLLQKKAQGWLILGLEQVSFRNTKQYCKCVCLFEIKKQYYIHTYIHTYIRIYILFCISKRYLFEKYKTILCVSLFEIKKQYYIHTYIHTYIRIYIHTYTREIRRIWCRPQSRFYFTLFFLKAFLIYFIFHTGVRFGSVA